MQNSNSIEDADYRANCDFDRDGDVDGQDYSYASAQYGTSVMPALPAGKISFAGAGGADNSIGYDGYVYNWPVALYTVRFRNYSPVHGRWLERDPIGYIEGALLYQYISGNPITGYDPIGLFPWKSVLKWSGGVIIIGVSVPVYIVIKDVQWEVNDLSAEENALIRDIINWLIGCGGKVAADAQRVLDMLNDGEISSAEFLPKDAEGYTRDVIINSHSFIAGKILGAALWEEHRKIKDNTIKYRLNVITVLVHESNHFYDGLSEKDAYDAEIEFLEALIDAVDNGECPECDDALKDDIHKNANVAIEEAEKEKAKH